MHLVVHATLGSRIMRAWGLSLRKRFCRQFNFELQASALEDSLILSLGETHSFESEEVPGYLKPATVRNVLVQALLDAPLFEVRWRWNATTSLAVQRMRNGQRLPPQWQRNQAEDLVAVVFPDQLACLENIRGEREIPDHPLVRQTLEDCLHEAMDIDGLVVYPGSELPLLDALMPEAFAVVREASQRTIGLRHYDVQLVGGMVLHQGKIAEMKTGEGKTLMATLAVYLNSLAGNSSHVVTVNDYLARRDAEWMGPVYRALGLTVGVVVPGMTPPAKRAAYACDRGSCNRRFTSQT